MEIKESKDGNRIWKEEKGGAVDGRGEIRHGRVYGRNRIE